MRASLPDRPGFLALLTRACGEAGVNILGVQIFPGVGTVTDELVVRTPSGWTRDDLRAMVVAAGATEVVVAGCSESALVDQPTRHVQAARALLAEPRRFAEVVAGLLDAQVGDLGDPPVPGGSVGGVMDLRVAGTDVRVRREAPFTATEHARAAAFGELVDDLLTRAAGAVPGGGRRLGGGAVPVHHVVADGLRAVVDGVVVGSASIGDPLDADPLVTAPASRSSRPAVVRPVEVVVDPSWRRRGVGTRLLRDVARLAGEAGADEIRLTTAADNQAVLPMVLAAGLRGRVRVSGECLSVVIGVRELAGLRR